jgi:hypothetical protein
MQRFRYWHAFFCTVCRWGPFANALLGILPILRPLPCESFIHPEPLLLHLRITSQLQVVPAQHEFENRAAGDAVKGSNPAAVVEWTSSPPRIVFTSSDRYHDTVPERTISILPYVFDQCGPLDDGTLHRQTGRAHVQMGPIDKRCRT